MKHKVLMTVILSMCVSTGMCQMTIGSHNTPEKANLLQIENRGGLGFSRVKLESLTTLEPFIPLVEQTATIKKNHTGLTVYNLSTTGGFKQGIYTWDGERWTKAKEGGGNGWFYMPPFDLPLDKKGQTYTYDLYGEYESRFDIKMGTAYKKNELDYAVIQYNKDIIEVTGIDDSGVMTYTVKDDDPDPTSFMTVIFIPKNE
ncbi:hypothetical protein [Parabacteroides sp. PF5-9]|uniref:hypothetical protein n=1 Tax=Parabacteroides sp. PF5-9 TaxID=1742404 RepID=UPI002476A538|nr:hypothetical protein [Parabacteroides sp. PF5-9]MDH6357554.1 hypothetical protein [Parabacteroides sp. PF5-9]